MCGRPEEIKNAQMEANGPWYNGTRIRYSCAKGYKRKAGTSNLIVCRQNKSMFEWSLPNLTCIRDPSTTDPPNTTEDFRKETETSTPTRQPATPKSSVDPVIMVSPSRYGSKRASQPPPGSTTTVPLTTAAPSSNLPVMTTAAAATTEGGECAARGTVTEGRVLPGRTATQDPQPKTSKPLPETQTTGNRWTAVPSRGTTGHTTQLDGGSSPAGQSGSPGIRIAFTCTVVPFIVIILGLLLWCFYRKNRDIPGTVPPLEEIPMTSKGSEERSQMIATASYLDDQGPCREGDQALLPQDVPSTG
ncbi:interleukin-15 receptor subunit alpha isoform X2 [Hemicordylus capensis]|nr:interleukin-15 receptor subunit alpha isoform X2 [Hemicordylus capensis]XP_053113952.1 interleukin-15 receptor subunit alpha isoform X2 [Hemicordylus capensis]XP_053113953.1 interleukin-15 receptor subunit alpha isoform X2 [Hemicordylus capensis]XP_053113954.1 interleukin-15 receptor subunit alpha isoform X2 [Hemicordylus capensis]XP_053113955.1 interleukin-15 receptor subunit alpha isoform X2 [Hemicordylus capensis]XP_053113956.1 interleukin-15 receptor subunit alpha isoform X2 [Hemicordyl